MRGHFILLNKVVLFLGTSEEPPAEAVNTGNDDKDEDDDNDDINEQLSKDEEVEIKNQIQDQDPPSQDLEIHK